MTRPRPTPHLRSCQLAIALGVLALFGLAHGAVYDPALEWRTLRSEHFHIHYPLPLATEAQHLSRIAEQVHAPMTELLGWEPAAPTEVTLVDNTDLANGYATVLPYNQIVLFAARPPLASTIGAYRDWLRTLFVHEYAHILALDPVRGYSAATRFVFGRVGFPATPYGALFWFLAAPPNLFLPPWYHEGLATNLETDFTGGGRKDSTFYRMIYRMDVAEDSIPPLDRLGGDFPDWPSYSTRYIYGARLLQLVAEEHGQAAFGQLNLGHAGRFPFTIDAPAEGVAGGNYSELYTRMVATLEAEYRPEIEHLRRRGLTPIRVVTATGRRTVAPLWLDAQRLVYTHAGAYGPAELRLHDLVSGREQTLAARPGSLNRPTRSASGELLYPRSEIHRPWAGGQRFTDLYRLELDADRRHPRRLTRGQRLVAADYHRASGRLAAVQLVDGRHRLVLLSPQGELEQVLLQHAGTRYDSPRWSPDGRTLAFGCKTDSGHARLALLEVASGEVTFVTPEGSQAGFPSWHPGGKQIAFSWDRSGIFDLYCYDLAEGTTRRLTRLLGGALEPDWAPDGSAIAFSNYSARGFDVAILQLSDALWQTLPPRPTTTAGPTSAPAPVPATNTPPPTAPEEGPYSAWPRGLPTFWLPDLQTDHQGLAPGAWSAGHDPLYRHKYYAAAFWAGASHRFYGQSIYRNDVTYPTLTFHAHKLPQLHADLLETGTGDVDYWEEQRSVGVEARLQLPRALRHFSFAAAWAWQEVARLSRVDQDLGGQRAFQGRLNPLVLSALYDSAFPHRNRFTVGPEDGRQLETLYRLRSPRLGAELRRQELVATWREYLPLVPQRHTVLALRASAATSWGDQELQGAFQLGGGESEWPLRGYPPRVARGKQAVLTSAELRFVLGSLYRGIRDLPLFLGKLHGAAFFDGGRTWRGDNTAWRSGVGAELRADTVLGYYLPTTLVLGWARGLDEAGEAQIYFSVRNVL